MTAQSRHQRPVSHDTRRGQTRVLAHAGRAAALGPEGSRGITPSRVVFGGGRRRRAVVSSGSASSASVVPSSPWCSRRPARMGCRPQVRPQGPRPGRRRPRRGPASWSGPAAPRPPVRRRSFRPCRRPRSRWTRSPPSRRGPAPRPRQPRTRCPRRRPDDRVALDAVAALFTLDVGLAAEAGDGRPALVRFAQSEQHEDGCGLCRRRSPRPRPGPVVMRSDRR